MLYLGSGLGLALLRVVCYAPRAALAKSEWTWLVAAILFRGVAGPVLLMWALATLPASAAALLLNAESVFSALLAWFVFRENFDRRIAVGMLLIVCGALIFSWPG